MILRSGGWSLLSGSALCVLLSSCAIQLYPGQPGVRTNGAAKIDMEYLDQAGLWVYEVTYDNSPRGGGVEQVVTKLYPGANTYTSNVRTNADGSNYRHKFAAQGAKIQMISLPKENTVIVPPDSQVEIVISYDKSLNEIDDRNLSEDELFKAGAPRDQRSALEALSWKWDVLRAGQFSEGRLSYTIVKLRCDGEELDLSGSPLQVSTTISQSGIYLNAAAEQKKVLRAFINEKFPQGFKGNAELVLSGGQSLRIPLALATLETLKASGTQVIVKDLNAAPIPATIRHQSHEAKGDR